MFISESNSVQTTHETISRSSQVKEQNELVVTTKSVVNHPCCSTTAAKSSQCEEKDSMSDLLFKIIAQQGYLKQSKIEWKNHNQLELSNVPQSVLHAFALKAEELGKSIQYEKTFTLAIK